MEELRIGAYVCRYQYPVTLAATYGLLFRSSCQFATVKMSETGRGRENGWGG